MSESWYYVCKSTGKIMRHWEPDGWSYMRSIKKGEKFPDKEVNMESLHVVELVRLAKELDPDVNVPSNAKREELLGIVRRIVERGRDTGDLV